MSFLRVLERELLSLTPNAYTKSRAYNILIESIKIEVLTIIAPLQILRMPTSYPLLSFQRSVGDDRRSHSGSRESHVRQQGPFSGYEEGRVR